MRNTISLGQFELQLAEINSSINNNESISQEALINELPNLFDLYNKGKEIAQESISNSDYDGKSFSKRVNNLLVPQLTESNSVESFDKISNEILDTIPEAKDELDSIRTVEGGGNNNNGIQALPVLPIVYGLIFLLGVARGASDGKKKKK